MMDDRAFKILVLNLLRMLLHLAFWHVWESRKEIEPELRAHFDNVQRVTRESIQGLNNEVRFEKWYPEFRKGLKGN